MCACRSDAAASRHRDSAAAAAAAASAGCHGDGDDAMMSVVRPFFTSATQLLHSAVNHHCTTHSTHRNQPNHCCLLCLSVRPSALFCSVLFGSRTAKEQNRTYVLHYKQKSALPIPHRRLATPCTYFLHLSLSSVILTDSFTGSPVHVLMFSIQAVCGLPRLRAPGIVPCIISFSRQLPCFLTV